MSEAETVIEFQRVEKSFGSLPVLRGVDLRIRAGETFTILGGSGSGKSVCLKHMVRLMRADRGRVIVLGASFVWTVEKTRWPVSAARIATSPVSRSRRRSTPRCASMDSSSSGSCDAAESGSSTTCTVPPQGRPKRWASSASAP